MSKTISIPNEWRTKADLVVTNGTTLDLCEEMIATALYFYHYFSANLSTGCRCDHQEPEVICAAALLTTAKSCMSNGTFHGWYEKFITLFKKTYNVDKELIFDAEIHLYIILEFEFTVKHPYLLLSRAIKQLDPRDSQDSSIRVSNELHGAALEHIKIKSISAEEMLDRSAAERVADAINSSRIILNYTFFGSLTGEKDHELIDVFSLLH